MIMIFKIFYIILVFNSLSSIAFGPFPMPWLSCFISIFFGALVLPSILKNKLVFNLFIFLIILLTFSTIFTLFQWETFKDLLSNKYQLDYYIYIFIRYSSFLSFFSTFFIIYKLSEKNNYKQITNIILKLSLVISLYAIYLYIAHFLNLPDILPRNRAGTGGFGSEQSIIFTYGFHRAIGTFREPSLFAEWLILPLFLSFSIKNKLKNPAFFIILLTFILTGSLGGLISVGLALIIYLPLGLILQGKIKFLKLSKTKIIMFSVFLLILLFININFELNYFSTIYERIEPILKFGIKGTNRGEVYRNLSLIKPSFYGLGLGNFQIFAAEKLSLSNLYPSLNFYITYLTSFGFFGFFVFLLVLFYPFILFFKLTLSGKTFDKNKISFLMISYIAMLIIGAVNREELSVTFALPYSLLIVYCNLILSSKYEFPETINYKN